MIKRLSISAWLASAALLALASSGDAAGRDHGQAHRGAALGHQHHGGQLLAPVVAARLEALGVPAEQIETVGGCTVESPGLASYRRDGDAAGPPDAPQERRVVEARRHQEGDPLTVETAGVPLGPPEGAGLALSGEERPGGALGGTWTVSQNCRLSCAGTRATHCPPVNRRRTKPTSWTTRHPHLTWPV